MKIRVDCYAGYRGEETPVRIHFACRSVDVVQVLDRWLAPDHRYFKLLCSDKAVYIIRHDVNRWFWELAYFNRDGGSVPGRAEKTRGGTFNDDFEHSAAKREF